MVLLHGSCCEGNTAQREVVEASHVNTIGIHGKTGLTRMLAHASTLHEYDNMNSCAVDSLHLEFHMWAHVQNGVADWKTSTTH